MILDSFKSFKKNLYNNDIVYSIGVLKELKPDQGLGIIQLKENIRLIVEEYETEYQKIEESFFEVHDYTLDIQYPLIGCEMTYFTINENLKAISEYQKNKDLTYYSICKGIPSKIITGNNTFAIYYPGNPHSPKKAVKSEKYLIKKATIKITTR